MYSSKHAAEAGVRSSRAALTAVSNALLAISFLIALLLTLQNGGITLHTVDQCSTMTSRRSVRDGAVRLECSESNAGQYDLSQSESYPAHAVVNAIKQSLLTTSKHTKPASSDACLFSVRAIRRSSARNLSRLLRCAGSQTRSPNTGTERVSDVTLEGKLCQL